MPYEVSFSKPVAVSDESRYINECCHGGDVVSDLLLPVVKGRFEDIQANQEDWGWFIWFRRGPVRLAIDIVCDDPKPGHSGSTSPRGRGDGSCSTAWLICRNWKN